MFIDLLIELALIALSVMGVIAVIDAANEEDKQQLEAFKERVSKEE